MILTEINKAKYAFIEKYGQVPNAIIMDYYGSTIMSEVLSMPSVINAPRLPGARIASILGLEVIQADIPGFIVCLR